MHYLVTIFRIHSTPADSVLIAALVLRVRALPGVDALSLVFLGDSKGTRAADVASHVLAEIPEAVAAATVHEQCTRTHRV